MPERKRSGDAECVSEINRQKMRGEDLPGSSAGKQ